MKLLIGLSGRKQAGKDTSAFIIKNLLLQHKDNKIEIKHFADKLKQIVCLLIGCDLKDLENNEFKERPLSEEWNRYVFQSDENIIIYADSMEKYNGFSRAGMKFLRTENLNPRKLLQILGTECGREKIHEQIWITSLFADYHKNDAGWIISDVRFKNEINAILNKKGIIIRIENPRIQNKDQHSSETELDHYKFENVIVNDGSIRELTEKIKKLLINLNVLEDEFSKN